MTTNRLQAENESPKAKTDSESENLNRNEAKQHTNIPRGKPKSGRVWKSTKSRFSSVIKTRGVRNSLEKKQALRQELKRVKEASRSILSAKQEEKEQRKQRRRENLQKREENRKKSEIVQVIKNPSKIKRMKKKQLRYIEKCDTSNL